MRQDEVTIVTDCESASDYMNVTLSNIAEFTLTLTRESFSIFNDEKEDVLKPWIDFHEIMIDQVRKTHGVLNSSGLIRGGTKYGPINFDKLVSGIGAKVGDKYPRCSNLSCVVDRCPQGKELNCCEWILGHGVVSLPG